MSQDQAVGRKEKKAQRDADRHKQGRKRKRETVALPEGVEEEHAEVEKDFIPLETGDAADGVAPKPSKDKKRKREEGDAQAGEEASADAAAPAKRKKRRKAKSAATNGTEGAQGAEDGANPNPYQPHKSRFIVFVGNLPYTTTDASLQEHFKKLQPFTVRHRTDPKTKQSKGFAFLEFENYDRMGTCLKLYHHSMFDPADYPEPGAKGGKPQGKGKNKGGRKINVELTSGGGGKGEVRKEKIREKNVKLEEERQRRFEMEREEQEAQVRKAKRAPQGKKMKLDDDVPQADGAAADAAGAMHPSRLARMKG